MTTGSTLEMTNVAEFIRIRQRIELLTKQIEYTTASKEATGSIQRFDEATKLLVTLAAMANNDVQEIVIRRLTRQLINLGIKIRTLKGKKRVSRKQPVV